MLDYHRRWHALFGHDFETDHSFALSCRLDGRCSSPNRSMTSTSAVSREAIRSASKFLYASTHWEISARTERCSSVAKEGCLWLARADAQRRQTATVTSKPFLRQLLRISFHLVFLNHIKTAHHCVVFMLQIVAMEQVSPSKLLETEHDKRLFARLESDRILPAFFMR